jgi:hypothetical protein
MKLGLAPAKQPAKRRTADWKYLPQIIFRQPYYLRNPRVVLASLRPFKKDMGRRLSKACNLDQVISVFAFRFL